MPGEQKCLILGIRIECLLNLGNGLSKGSEDILIIDSLKRVNQGLMFGSSDALLQDMQHVCELASNEAIGR
jgi:hypothetical protein